MLNEELARRAIVEALEGKIEALGGIGNPPTDAVLEVYFWDDLAEKHPKIFKGAKTEDISLMIAQAEKASEGRYRLLSVSPSMAKRDVLRVVWTHEVGKPIEDISNLFWKVKYSEGRLPSTETRAANVFWLTPRSLSTTIAGERCSIQLKPRGVRYRILEWLSEHEGFSNSEEMAKEIESSSRTIRSEIGALKKKAGISFAVDPSKFIESSQGEGYRLGKGIKIRISSGAV